MAGIKNWDLTNRTAGTKKNKVDWRTMEKRSWQTPAFGPLWKEQRNLAATGTTETQEGEGVAQGRGQPMLPTPAGPGSSGMNPLQPPHTHMRQLLPSKERRGDMVDSIFKLFIFMYHWE